MRAAEVVLVDVATQPAAQACARFLIESPVDAAEHARVIDVRGDPFEAAVLELGEGLTLLHEGIEQARSTGALMFRAHFLTLLAGAQLRGGCFADAQRTLDEAFQLTGRGGERTYAAEVHRLNAELALASRTGTDSRRLAERDLRTAIDIATQQGASLLALKAALSLARLRARDGDEETLRLVAEARARITEDSTLPELQAADALLSAGSGKIHVSAEQIGRP